MPERFVLGRPKDTGKLMESDERAIRSLVKAMSTITVIEPETVRFLAEVVLAWPPVEGTDEPPESRDRPTPRTSAAP